jgi:hypothetical protein
MRNEKPISKRKLFAGFDFSILELKSFKEDSVREEILHPIIRRMGFQASGRKKIIRSKRLTHPFVNIGSSKKAITLVPDYLLLINDRPMLVIDAKAPWQSIYKGENIEQAFSYAIHPDIRSPCYGLCNGKELVIFSITQLKPILNIAIKELDKNWTSLIELFEAIEREMPKEIELDWNMKLYKSGSRSVRYQYFLPKPIMYISKISTFHYLLLTNIILGRGTSSEVVTISFLLGAKMYPQFLRLQKSEVKKKIKHAMNYQPFGFAFIDDEITDINIISAKQLKITLEWNGFHLLPDTILFMGPCNPGEEWYEDKKLVRYMRKTLHQ